jgi:hypothetical protein
VKDVAQDAREQGVWIEDDERRRRAPSGSRPRGPAAVLWRLLFMHSSRGERLMDALGFFSVFAPALGKGRGRLPDARETALRHLGYFNGGVYLAPIVAGVVVNLEKRRAAGEDIPPAEVERIKATLSSVLAARANRFFDALVIPFGLTIAAIFAIYGSYIGPVIFLALYNFYHFQSRIGGYGRGVELGEGIGGAFVSRLFREARALEGLASFAAGVFAALLFVRAADAGGVPFVAAGAAAAAAAAVLGRRLSATAVACVTAAALAAFLAVRSFVAPV